MYHHVENPVLEHFSSPLAGVESWNILASEDFSCQGSKMMSDHPLIISEGDHFVTMKHHGMEEVVLDASHVFAFHDASELVVEQGSADEIILVPNAFIKQEEVIVDNEVIIGSAMESQLDEQFSIGSSIDVTGEPMFEDEAAIKDPEEDEDIEYNCGVCGVSFKNRTMLKKHIRNHHSFAKVSRSKVKKKGKQRYDCPSCNYSSQRRDKLDKHMERHVLLDGVHPCGKRRHKPEALPQRHRHNAEEYRCPYCPYACTVYRALKKHARMHSTGVEPQVAAARLPKLSCKICGKDRSTETEMTKHMKKHRRGEHFLCDLCSFSSVQLKKIIQHRRMHTGEKPHLCPHCAYRSARRDNLRSHVRRMHKRENMYIDTFDPTEEAAPAPTY